MLKPINGRILVELLQKSTEAKTTASGIIIPVVDNKEDKCGRGKVVAVSEGIRYSNGELIPHEVKVGDVVDFNIHQTFKHVFEGVEYYSILGDQIMVIR